MASTKHAPLKVPVALRRSWRSLWYSWIVFFVLLALTLITASIDFWTVSIGPIPTPFGDSLIRLPIFGLLTLVAVARPWMLMHDTYHLITAHHVISTVGLMSLKKRTIEIAYEDVASVNVSQTILGRLLGYGNIVLGTYENEQPEIVLEGVKHPNRYLTLVSARIDHARVERRVEPVRKMLAHVERDLSRQNRAVG